MEKQIFLHAFIPKARYAAWKEHLLSCDKEDDPNIFILLAIACTLPVTTYENERQLLLLLFYHDRNRDLVIFH